MSRLSKVEHQLKEQGDCTFKAYSHAMKCDITYSLCGSLSMSGTVGPIPSDIVGCSKCVYGDLSNWESFWEKVCLD
jgi:hypothetical protein